MDPKTTEIVGIAAAVAGHCQKCFVYHFNEAKKLGIDIVEIKETVELSKAIRRAGDTGMDDFVNKTLRLK